MMLSCTNIVIIIYSDTDHFIIIVLSLIMIMLLLPRYIIQAYPHSGQLESNTPDGNSRKYKLVKLLSAGMIERALKCEKRQHAYNLEFYRDMMWTVG